MVKVKLSGTPEGVFEVLKDLGLAPREIVVNVPLEKIPSVTLKAVQTGVTVTIIPSGADTQTRENPVTRPAKSMEAGQPATSMGEPPKPERAEPVNPPKTIQPTPARPPKPVAVEEPTTTTRPQTGKPTRAGGPPEEGKKQVPPVRPPRGEEVVGQAPGGGRGEALNVEEKKRILLGIIGGEVGVGQGGPVGGEELKTREEPSLSTEESLARAPASEPMYDDTRTRATPVMISEQVERAPSPGNSVGTVASAQAPAPAPIAETPVAEDGDLVEMFREISRVQEEALRRTPIEK